MRALNPQALLLPDCNVTISLAETQAGRGYAHIRVSLGLSRWSGVLPVGCVAGDDSRTTTPSNEPSS